jgi:signal transduction histidine kinase
VVEGSEQELREYVTIEICRIVREALRNAFQHAQASHVEAEVTFRDMELRLSLRDDGLGINPSVLSSGARSGHWGIIGMRERAARLGAQLNFWTRPGAGTEIELTVPGRIAYKSSPPRLFGRFSNRTKS